MCQDEILKSPCLPFWLTDRSLSPRFLTPPPAALMQSWTHHCEECLPLLDLNICPGPEAGSENGGPLQGGAGRACNGCSGLFSLRGVVHA